MKLPEQANMFEVILEKPKGLALRAWLCFLLGGLGTDILLLRLGGGLCGTGLQLPFDAR